MCECTCSYPTQEPVHNYISNLLRQQTLLWLILGRGHMHSTNWLTDWLITGWNVEMEIGKEWICAAHPLVMNTAAEWNRQTECELELVSTVGDALHQVSVIELHTVRRPDPVQLRHNSHSESVSFRSQTFIRTCFFFLVINPLFTHCLLGI